MPDNKGIQESILNAAMLRWMNELAPQGILITDIKLNVCGWNQWLEIHTGRSHEEVIGRNLLEIYPELADRRLDRYYQNALQGQSSILSQTFHKYLLPMSSRDRGKGPELMQQSARISPLVHDGEVIGTVTLIENVTGRVIREAELQVQIEQRAQLLMSERAARAQAEQANRLKDDFLATVSHELRTPLTAILGWTHLLLNRDFDEENALQGIQTIERNAKSQLHLIEDLLDVSRILAGKLRLDVREVDLTSVIDEAIDSIRLGADAKGIHLEKIFEHGPTSVAGDRERLLQVVWNLLSNAIKFTPQEGRVDVRLSYADPNLKITISDTGQGLDASVLPYVFDRFRQGDSSATGTQGGLGLGLAIVRQIIELHGGTVEAKSGGRNQGATFVVTLPIAKAASREPSASGNQKVVPAKL